jgi:DNA-binding NarL/FixJ family response regulator
MIRVFIADDQALVRQGIRALLDTDPGFIVAGEAENGDAVLAALPQCDVDVLLLDVRMPGRNGSTCSASSPRAAAFRPPSC